MLVMSVDPGINTGLCFWDSTLKRIRQLAFIQEFTPFSRSEYPARIGYLTSELKAYMQEVKPTFMVMESTAFWETSHKSRVCARSGSLQFLSMILGSYIEAAHSFGIGVTLVSPVEWKGQLTDRLIKWRAARIIPASLQGYYTDNIHVCCAVGIGAHYFNLGGFGKCSN